MNNTSKFANGTYPVLTSNIPRNQSLPLNSQKFLNSAKENRDANGVPRYFTKQNISDAFGEHEASKISVFEKLQDGIDKNQVYIFVTYILFITTHSMRELSPFSMCVKFISYAFPFTSSELTHVHQKKINFSLI